MKNYVGWNRGRQEERSVQELEAELTKALREHKLGAFWARDLCEGRFDDHVVFHGNFEDVSLAFHFETRDLALASRLRQEIAASVCGEWGGTLAARLAYQRQSDEREDRRQQSFRESRERWGRR